jgi:nitrous oxidase accessory protein
VNGALATLTALVAAAILCIAPLARGDATFDLSAAIRRAEPGAMLRVPAGVHAGPIVIDRPLTLEGDDGAVIDGGGNGDVVRIEAPDVIVRGLLIRNSGTSLDREHAGIVVLAPRATIDRCVIEDALFGVTMSEAPDSILRDTRIRGKDLDIARRGDTVRLWTCPRVVIERCVIERGRDVVLWFSSGVVLRDNHVRDNRYGLHFMYSDDNVFEGNRLEDNSVGAFLMYSRRLTLQGNIFAGNRGPSGYGVGLKDVEGISARDNLFSGNRVGVYLDNSPFTIDGRNTFERNAFSGNDIAVAFQPSVKRNAFFDNTFLDNIEHVAVLGAGDFRDNAFTVDGRGNFWSDYRGFDLDGDGVGDMPYESVSLFENLMDREPKLRLLLHSPVQKALDVASRAFPVVQPRPKFADAAPRMSPARVQAAVETGEGRTALAWTAGAMLAAALALIGAAVAPARRPSPSPRRSTS